MVVLPNRHRRHRPSVSRSYSAGQLPERRPLVHRDVIGRIALDLILRIIPAGMNGVTFEPDPGRDDSGDPAADPPGFGVPAHVISPSEAFLSHSIAPYAGMVKS